MNITKALQIIQDHPEGPLSLGVTVLDDGIIVGAITLARDPMETLASYYGPGTVEGAIIEMVKIIFSPNPYCGHMMTAQVEVEDIYSCTDFGCIQWGIAYQKNEKNEMERVL